MNKKPTKKPTPRKTPKHKVDQFVEKVVAGKSGPDAVIESGWNQSRKAARVTASRLLSNANIAERVERRKAEAMRRSQIHTDIVVGSLAEIATASIGDVLDENGRFSIQHCRKMHTDHLLKKVTETVRTSKDGSSRTTYSYEMYSRLDALQQLRDNFGMKQEARPNNFDETRRAEVERSIKSIMEREEVDQPTAAKMLLEELGDASQLTSIVNSYVN